MRILLACLLMFLSLPLAAARHHLLIVSGIGGLDEYQQRFDGDAVKLYRAASDVGIEANDIYLLSPTPIEDAAVAHRRSDLEGIENALTEIGQQVEPGDTVFAVLLGHGNPRGDSALFNLPGPDLSAEQLDGWLEAFDQQTLVVVNTASASGPFVNRLTRPGRIIITATSSGREYHAVQFGEFFVAAFAEPGADRDKDEKISLLEAFDYARREVRRAYEGEKRLLTEHALLDDNGDGVGSLEPGEFKQDGPLAMRVFLQPPPALSGQNSAQLRAMLERKQSLELSIGDLKRQRDSMAKLAYYDQLEVLLIDLARLSRDIRARGGS